MNTVLMTKSDNEIYLGKFKLSDLAKEYQTPLYVYDEKEIYKNISIFKDNFFSNKVNCRIAYASKAFLVPRLAHIIDQEGLYVDAISYGDLYILHRSGFPMERVLLHGNNKSKEDLMAAIKLGVGLIVIDNVVELEELIKLSVEHKQPINTLFRVNPEIDVFTHRYINTSASDSKFGESILDEGKMKYISELYKKSEYVLFDGFHAHVGSQINEFKSYQELTRIMLEFSFGFESKYHLKVNTLNIGGGFGVNYLPNQARLNLEETLKGIVLITEKFILENKFKLDNLFIEPGRSIIASAGMSLYKVGSVKKTYGGKQFIFVDGGMTDNIRPALYDAKYHYDIANRVQSKEKAQNYDIVGKCCESGDIVILDAEVCGIERDDIIVVYRTGAYGYSMSSNYNGLVKPAVIFVDEERVVEVVRRETVEDLVKTFNFEV